MTRKSLRERGADATRNLREMLRLPGGLADATLLGTALAEVAAEEGHHNPEFMRAIRARYDDLVEQSAKSTPRQKQELPPLVPVGRLEPGERLHLDPYAPPDPVFLTRVYGQNQLARALQEYTLDMLKQTAERIQQQHLGTKPKNRSSKASVIAYIVEHS